MDDIRIASRHLEELNLQLSLLKRLDAGSEHIPMGKKEFVEFVKQRYSMEYEDRIIASAWEKVYYSSRCTDKSIFDSLNKRTTEIITISDDNEDVSKNCIILSSEDDEPGDSNKDANQSLISTPENSSKRLSKNVAQESNSSTKKSKNSRSSKKEKKIVSKSPQAKPVDKNETLGRKSKKQRLNDSVISNKVSLSKNGDSESKLFKEEKKIVSKPPQAKPVDKSDSLGHKPKKQRMSDNVLLNKISVNKNGDSEPKQFKKGRRKSEPRKKRMSLAEAERLRKELFLDKLIEMCLIKT